MPLPLMISFSKTMIPSLQKPGLFINDMILTKQSFRDVNMDDLYDLISKINQRADDGLVGFEHL